MRTNRSADLLAPAVATLLLAALSPAQRSDSSAEVFDVPGTDATVRTWSVDGTEKSAVSRDRGLSWTALPDQSYSIHVRGRFFDPKLGDQNIPPLLSALHDNRLFYVQFRTDVIPEYLTALSRLGVEVTRYVPDQAYIVRMSRGMIAAVDEQPFVRAVADVHTAHKLETSIIDDVVSGAMGIDTYNIMLVDKKADARGLEQAVRALGGTDVAGAQGGVLMVATLTPAQLIAVANDSRVIWVDRLGEPGVDIDMARAQGGMNYVETVAGVDGKGMRGHVIEGVHGTHPEFAAIPPYRTAAQPVATFTTATSGHGTNTAGEIYARGARPLYKGLMPFAQMYYTHYLSGPRTIFNTNNRYPLAADLQDATKIYKALVQTSSWGYPQTNQYTSRSAEMDDITFDFPRMFTTNSQSNTSTTASRPQAWAKNVVGVGGFRSQNNSDPSDDCYICPGLNSQASTGPAADGRVGVSFAAFYDSAIRTTSGASGYTTTFCCTSGATPIINGLAGGAIQMIGDGHFGYPAVPVDAQGVPQRFEMRPNLTTTRVLVTLGTRQLPFTGTRRASRFQQGWGFPNLQDLYDNRDNILLLDEEDVLSQGQSRTYFVWVRPGTSEFRASMHYLEDEALPFANPTRINSLDLWVSEPDGSLHRGNNNSMMNGAWSAPGGAANDRDVHENVFLADPTSGVYRVGVRATAIRADQHRETATMDADFALGIRGIGGGRDRSGMVLDLISDAPGQLDVSLANVPGGWTTGYTLLSADTGRHASLGNVFGLEADALALSILGVPPSAGSVFAFTSSGTPAQYPNATFSFPAAVAAALQGIELDGVAYLLDASGGFVDVSNVDRVSIQ